MHNKTLSDIAADLAAQRYSSVELTQHYLNRIKAFDKDLNSFITVTEETALADAKAADQLRSAGQARSLTGVPIALKDIFCTDGIKTTCASKMLHNFVSPYDATVAANFKAAGAVLLGKTNMDEFAMGSSNETSYYGVCKNPWDTHRVPGGSSGGSAAAVAARLTPGATGTDTGGSIRQPAAFCGISGLKPTYGRVSRYGMIAYASSLDHGGPMAQTAKDLAMMLQVMAGYDPKDSTSINRPVPNYLDTIDNPIKGLRIGLPEQYFGEGLDSGVADAVHAAVDVLKSQGAIIKNISLPHNKLSVPTYYIVAPAECSSNLLRYDGVRYGYRCENPKDLQDLYLRTRAEGFGKEVKRRIMVGTFALSSGYYDAYYAKAQKIRCLISQEYKNAFESVDVILGPTAPTPAFNIGEKVNDPISMYLSDIYTIPHNLAGFPAIAIPAGFVDGLPVGIQFCGNHFSENHLLNIANRYQQATEWHTKLPEDFA